MEHVLGERFARPDGATMTTYLSTGIETLDCLLGGRGLPTGSSVLIRGEPGTGKTTLSLQIVESILRNRETSVLWLSVEQSASESIGQILESLWDQTYDEFNCSHPGFVARDVATEFAMGQWEAEADDTGARFEAFLRDLWEGSDYEKVDVLVLDSLNALTERAQLQWPKIPERQMVTALLRSLEYWRSAQKKKPTAILTAEGPGVFRSTASESYIADVVIELTGEKLEHIVQPESHRHSRWQEQLLFCRISKGRGLPIQRRASCYEFVKGQGITFYPTYASQGLVSLFFENAPQSREIRHLRDVDIPFLYPKVVVQAFTRSGLQRMFAIRRQAERTPPRHPMTLSSIDEYWVAALVNKHLLEPIPPKLLSLFSLEGAEFPDRSGPTQIIDELAVPKRDMYRDEGGKFNAVPYMANMGMLVYRADLLEHIGIQDPPQTWEELESICSTLKAKGLPHHFLLETQTYDSLMATVLELCWSHGVSWQATRAENGITLEGISFTDGDRAMLTRALERLHRWIHELELVPYQSTVDPLRHPEMDWAFARHWYSTWVDVLTRKAGQGKAAQAVVQNEDGMEFGVCAIPVAEAYRSVGKHHSAWGEWYLGIQRGSENLALGIDLINNMMTARKVAERALSGAGLPVVKGFYETYGSDMCFGTDLTFNEMRSVFLRNAKSRTEYADYRNVARVFSGTLKAIISNSSVVVSELLNGVVPSDKGK